MGKKQKWRADVYEKSDSVTLWYLGEKDEFFKEKLVAFLNVDGSPRIEITAQHRTVILHFRDGDIQVELYPEKVDDG